MLESKEKNKNILSEIRSGKLGRDKVIKELYYDQDLRNVIQSIIFNKGGQKDDFDVVFSTSLMQFVKTVVKNKEFVVSTTIHNYIIGISKFVWYDEIRKRGKHTSEDLDEQFDLSIEITPEILVINHNQKELIKELLQHLGKNCEEVLMYWANGFKMSEIAQLMGYKSEGMAKKKKHICFKELLGFLDENPHIKKLLK